MLIIGVFLNHFKTYSGIHYVPLTNGYRLCGLVGNNGIGKSSILESLDCLFNNRDWNYTLNSRAEDSYIVPVYLLERTKIKAENQKQAEIISEKIWNIDGSEMNLNISIRSNLQRFQNQRDALRESYNSDQWFLLPVGQFFEGKRPSLGIFTSVFLPKPSDNSEKYNKSSKNDGLSDQDCLNLNNDLKNLVEYIYIPQDISLSEFIQLETREIQVLMGQTLYQILDKVIGQGSIAKINKDLNLFVEELSGRLEEYEFRNPKKKSKNLTKTQIYNLVIEAFFKTKKLSRQYSGGWVALDNLSSGEKKKAILELAYQFLKGQYSRSDLILAIDEPESSLHISACYEQFSKLYDISTLCSQLLFTTHWYGFIPILEEGYINVISQKKGAETGREFDLIDARRYRESITQSIKISKGKLPHDIRLKGLNDLIQSIMNSLIADDPLNWLVCEGSSEKIYFEAYFKDLKDEKNLRIIPVGGAREIKRIYEHLALAYEDFKTEVQGRVLLISDTDRQLIDYKPEDKYKGESPMLCCRRIVTDLDKTKTRFAKIGVPDLVSPETEIEDALNGRIFLETLKFFQEENPDLKKILKDIETIAEDATSYFAIDLPPSERYILNDFFGRNNHKFIFATRYVRNMNDSYCVPDWIQQIRRFFVTGEKLN